jgi:hypothetical protein
MRPGDLVKLSCGAGYGYAYHPLRQGSSLPRKPSVLILEGTMLLYLGRDDVASDIRMQPMVRVLHSETLLLIDERFLELVQPDDEVV